MISCFKLGHHCVKWGATNYLPRRWCCVQWSKERWRQMWRWCTLCQSRLLRSWRWSLSRHAPRLAMWCAAWISAQPLSPCNNFIFLILSMCIQDHGGSKNIQFLKLGRTWDGAMFSGTSWQLWSKSWTIDSLTALSKSHTTESLWTNLLESSQSVWES